jgi:prepilin-type N-terminal cleavage/methylation domain-containing protein/prepilin-type processing-associated H-X9-DG protein
MKRCRKTTAFTLIELLAVSFRRQKAFTLIELLSVIAVIAILAALLFPVLGAAQERANQNKCMSNMKQWGTGIHLYLADHEGVFPDEGIDSSGTLNPEKWAAWYNTLGPYVGARSNFMGALCAADQAPQPNPGVNKTLFSCPSHKSDASTRGVPPSTPVFSYGYNLWIDHEKRAGDNPNGRTGFGRVLRLSQIMKPSKFVVWGEVSSVNFDNMDTSYIVYRHQGTNAANFVFADGHVSTLTRAQTYNPAALQKYANTGVIWDPEGVPDQNSSQW